MKGEIPAAIAKLRWSRDADDDKFIQTALAGSAMWLVTCDQDLLTINAALNVRIVSPAQALLMEDFPPLGQY